MRYGSNSIASQLDALKVAGATRVLILPAYPQYSATTTASVFDAVYTWAAATRNIPEFRFVNHYHDDPRYIAALAGKVQAYWQTNGRLSGIGDTSGPNPAAEIAIRIAKMTRQRETKP